MTISFQRLSTILSLAVLVIVAISCQSTSTKTETVQEEVAQKYEPNWQSLSAFEIPEWFRDAKLGIFIHWGPYAVPAYHSEWYPRLMYMDTATFNAHYKLESEGPSHVYTHHMEKWGAQKKFGYKDFIPMFQAENFDASEWIKIFKDAGAKYVIPVAEHHDGFAMYDSDITRWNSVDMGPKVDVVGELFKAGRAEGLKMGVSSHFAFNWAYFNKKDHFDTVDPEFSDLYSKKGKAIDEPVSEEFKQLWWDRTTNIIDKYEPDALWLDFFVDQPDFKEFHPKLASYYYNKGIEWGKDVAIQDKNHKYKSFPEGTIIYDLERGKMAGIHELPWQTDTSLGKKSWCHTEGWESKESNTLVDDLIDIVSKNGCMLLNVGPKADGTIPEDQKAILADMGAWLRVNGDAIYDARCWKTFGEGPTESEDGYMSEKKKQDAFVAEDIRFTTKDNKLYAIALDWPESNKTLIKSLVKGSEFCSWDIQNVRMLGVEGDLEWAQGNEGLEITLPDTKPCKFAYTFEIDFGKDSELATKNYLTMK